MYRLISDETDGKFYATVHGLRFESTTVRGVMEQIDEYEDRNQLRAASYIVLPVEDAEEADVDDENYLVPQSFELWARENGF